MTLIDTALVFAAVLAALTADRWIGTLVQMWGARRMFRHLDAEIQRKVRAQADDVRREPRKRAN